jgi:uncharacterized membrane protein YbhN (UPF0104 family)
MLATGSLLAGLVWIVDVDDLIAGINQAEGVWLMVAIALVPANIGLEILKWNIMLHPSGRSSWADATGSVFVGYTFGLLSPARIGDYVGRAIYFESDRFQIAILTAIDRILSMVVCIAAGLVAVGAAVAMDMVTVSGLMIVTSLLGLTLGAGLTFLLLKPRRLDQLLSKVSAASSWQRATAFLSSVGSPDAMVLLGLSAARHLVFTAQLMVLVIAFGGFASWHTLAVCATLVFFVKTLIPQVTFADLGIRESVSIFFFGLAGVSTAAALNASLVIFGLNLVLPAVVGIALTQRIQLSLPSLERARARLKWTARL